MQEDHIWCQESEMSPGRRRRKRRKISLAFPLPLALTLPRPPLPTSSRWTRKTRRRICDVNVRGALNSCTALHCTVHPTSRHLTPPHHFPNVRKKLWVTLSRRKKRGRKGRQGDFFLLLFPLLHDDHSSPLLWRVVAQGPSFPFPPSLSIP